MENADSVVPYGVLLKKVWGYYDPTATDVFRAAYRLSRKLLETTVIRITAGHRRGSCGAPVNTRTGALLWEDELVVERARSKCALDAA
jgi:hypothetical protein